MRIHCLRPPSSTPFASSCLSITSFTAECFMLQTKNSFTWILREALTRNDFDKFHFDAKESSEACNNVHSISSLCICEKSTESMASSNFLMTATPPFVVGWMGLESTTTRPPTKSFFSETLYCVITNVMWHNQSWPLNNSGAYMSSYILWRSHQGKYLVNRGASPPSRPCCVRRVWCHWDRDRRKASWCRRPCRSRCGFCDEDWGRDCERRGWRLKERDN